ncbi:MAG: hypothetical protein R2794_09040 [Chitinophagales bacterium]
MDSLYNIPACRTYTLCLTIETGGCTEDMFCQTVVIGGGDCSSDFEYANEMD